MNKRRFSLIGIVAIGLIVGSVAFAQIRRPESDLKVPGGDALQQRTTNGSNGNSLTGADDPETEVHSDTAGRSGLKSNPRKAKTKKSTATNAANDLSTATPPKSWLPSGRFLHQVFESGDIETSEIAYGSGTGFDGNPQTVYMTISKPKNVVDQENARPVIFALSGGGDLGAYCNSTYTTEQAAMEQAAQLGYIGIALRPIMDPDAFCDYAQVSHPENYIVNIVNNLQALYTAQQYVADHAGSLGADSSRMGSYGYSVGGTTVLLQTRPDFTGGLPLKAIAGYSAIAPADFGGYVTVPSGSSQGILMISYEDDIGLGGATSHAAEECSVFGMQLRYTCVFGSVAGSGHNLHALDTTPITVDGQATTTRDTFINFMYQNLVAF